MWMELAPLTKPQLSGYDPASPHASRAGADFREKRVIAKHPVGSGLPVLPARWTRPGPSCAHSNGNQHGCIPNIPILAHFFVTRVKIQIGGLSQWAVVPLLQLLIHLTDYLANRTGGDADSAHPLQNGSHFARGGLWMYVSASVRVRARSPRT